MKARLAYLKAMIVIGLARMLIRLPDKVLVRVISILSFFAILISLPPEAKETLKEVQLIFEKGGQGSRIARDMLRVGSRQRIRMIVRSAFLP